VGFGEQQIGLGCFWGGFMVFGEFRSILGVILFLFQVFFMCFGVSIGFRCDFRGHRVGNV